MANENATAGVDACAAWAKAGECTRNALWMNSNCAQQCCSVCAARPPAKTAAAVRPVVAAPVSYLKSQQQFLSYGFRANATGLPNIMVGPSSLPYMG